jgi:hypothetical protein
LDTVRVAYYRYFPFLLIGCPQFTSAPNPISGQQLTPISSTFAKEKELTVLLFGRRRLLAGRRQASRQKLKIKKTCKQGGQTGALTPHVNYFSGREQLHRRIDRIPRARSHILQSDHIH